MIVTNEAACAYAAVAATEVPPQLRQNDKFLAVSLYNQMIELMDVYTEAEILAKMHNILCEEAQ